MQTAFDPKQESLVCTIYYKNHLLIPPTKKIYTYANFYLFIILFILWTVVANHKALLGQATQGEG